MRHLILEEWSSSQGVPNGRKEVSRGVPSCGGRFLARPLIDLAAKSLNRWGSAVARWSRGQQSSIRPTLLGALNADERADLVRLRIELVEVKQEREILKKAAQYFAKETTR